MNSSELKEAWITASVDLGIKVNTSFKITGVESIFILIEDFGGKTGTMVIPIGAINEVQYQIILTQGYYCSQVGNDYNHYNRDYFIDTLNDWGYFGDDSLRPDWFTGEPWG